MSPAAIRAAVYSVVAFLALAALRLNPPIARRPAELLVAPPRGPITSLAPVWRQHVDTVERGETLRGVLTRGGLSEAIAGEALKAATMLDQRRVPVGMPVTLRRRDADSVPSEIVFQLAVDHLAYLRRTAAGWVGSEERLPWATDTLVVSGRISSTLYEALDSAAAALLPRQARAELAWSLADIYEYRIDMSRDLHAGDEFRVLVERASAPAGVVRVGRILAAAFETGGSEVDAVRYGEGGGRGEYYDHDGKSLRAAFLRAPLAFRRIASGFGLRRHPILGVWREHKGTDYAAAMGTPVRAVGDGVIVRAAWYRGYGNCVDVRHRNGFVTRYGHLSRFAARTRVGAHVGIGETIAYVGMTGLATGPHLHFEVLIGGVQRDPRTALRTTGGDPVPARERTAFEETRDRLLASLENPPGKVQLAAR